MSAGCLSRCICLTERFGAWASVDSARTLAVQGCARGSFLDLIGRAVSLTKASHHVSETPGCEGEMTDDQTQVWIKLMMYWEWAQNDTRVAGLKPW